MKIFPTKFVIKAFVFIFLTLATSCSKDSDLLADYVTIVESPTALAEIKVFAIQNEPVVVSVTDPNDNTVVTDVSTPSSGTAVVNQDNTITYTPDPGVTGTDAFDYTTATTNTDQSVTTESGTIKITINTEVDYWKGRFDTAWKNETSVAPTNSGLGRMINADLATAFSKSGNYNNEYYFLAYYFDALIQIWQATGDNSYLDKVLALINNTMEDAIDVGGGYLGWPNADNKGYPLWDSYCWRFVSNLLNIMHRSPTLLASGNYQTQYQKILDFTEKNIWSRYEADGLSNFYRVNTHMSSHWARIGMDLYMITGKSKYKDVFDNISHGKMVGYPSNLREQIKNNAKVPTAYNWSQIWDGTNVQDTSHGGAIVSFIVAAYENDMYWSVQDINALASTLKDVIWLDKNGSEFFTNVDGSSGYELPGRLHEWLTLGRYNQTIQKKIKNDYIDNNLKYYGVEPLGIAALNARILADGAPIYPEQ